MPIPATFLARMDERGHDSILWLEVEGWPWAFGTFAARPAASRFEGVLPFIKRDEAGNAVAPVFGDQQVDHLGGRVDVGQCVVRIVDRDETLAGLTAIRRSDNFCLDLRRAGGPELGLLQPGGARRSHRRISRRNTLRSRLAQSM